MSRIYLFFCILFITGCESTPISPETTFPSVVGSASKKIATRRNKEVSKSSEKIATSISMINEKDIKSSLLKEEVNPQRDFLGVNLTPEITESLALLGKVWGFVANNQVLAGDRLDKWRAELLKTLPAYINAETFEVRSKIISSMVANAGEVDVSNEYQVSDDADLKLNDLVWINELELSEAVKNQLKHIYKYRKPTRTGKTDRVDGIADLYKWSKLYDKIDFSHPEQTLIALFEFWAEFKYYSPMYHFVKAEWEEALAEHVEEFLFATSMLEFESAFLRLATVTQDSAVFFSSRERAFRLSQGKYYPPLRAEFIERELVVVKLFDTEFREQLEVKVGDVITSINGVSIFDLVKERYQYYPTSNFDRKLAVVAPSLLQSDTRLLSIEIERDGKTLKKTLSLLPKPDALHYVDSRPKCSSSLLTIIQENIGYINSQCIDISNAEKLYNSIFSTDGLVIDMRGSQKPYEGFKPRWLVSTPVTFYKFARKLQGQIGEFAVVEGSWKVASKALPVKKIYGKPVILLVNEYTFGRAELEVMAMQTAKNVTVIGSDTGGAIHSNINYSVAGMSSTNFIGGIFGKISGTVFYYHGSDLKTKDKIKINHTKWQTIKSVREGKDDLIEFALALIQSKLSKISTP